MMATKVGRQLFLLSSSNVFGYDYLQHSSKEIKTFLDKNNVKKILFIPYAGFDHDGYTKKVADALEIIGFKTEGIHTHKNVIKAIENAQAIFIGGGNTFLLLKTLYDKCLVEPIQRRVINDGIPYMGSSAGTNVSTVSIKTTNDMPIIQPSTFNALNLIPFNINPHYMDSDPSNPHQGETRETRINEFHQINNEPVLGLREGTALLVNGDSATLIGDFNARLFQRGKEPIEYPPKSDLSFLLK